MAALLLLSAHATVILPRAVPLRSSMGMACRGAPRLSLDENKAALCKQLLYNKPLTEDGEALLRALVDGGGEAPVAGEQWWTGKLILRSCHDLARVLRAAGAPLEHTAAMHPRLQPKAATQGDPGCSFR